MLSFSRLTRTAGVSLSFWPAPITPFLCPAWIVAWAKRPASHAKNRYNRQSHRHLPGLPGATPVSPRRGVLNSAPFPKRWAPDATFEGFGAPPWQNAVRRAPLEKRPHPLPRRSQRRPDPLGQAVEAAVEAAEAAEGKMAATAVKARCLTTLPIWNAFPCAMRMRWTNCERIYVRRAYRAEPLALAAELRRLRPFTFRPFPTLRSVP